MSKRQVMVGNVCIGGDFIPIQSMTTTKTSDIQATIKQIKDLEDLGCDIVRVAIRNEQDAHALKEITSSVDFPIVGDIHFDFRLAIKSIENGAAKIRINPGNIGGIENIKAVVECARDYDIPIRIGVNGGSIQKEYQADYLKNTSEALVQSALKNIEIFESMGFFNLVISIKSSDVWTTADVHRRLINCVDHPIHLGITEAGFGEMAKIKSAIGIGGLLLDGIGDTIRVSITGDPMAEIPVAMDILKAVGKLAGAVNIISCPTCGRCRVNLPEIVKSFQEKARAFEMDRIKQARRLQKIGRTSEAKKSINVAIMGCAVNGPGEARHADIGMAAGDSNAVLFRRGEILKNADVDIIMDELFDLLRRE